MTAIESIFEIKSAVSALRRYTPSKSPSVTNKVQAKYLELIDRFFRENAKCTPGAFFEPEQRRACLDDMDYFIGIMDEAVEHYYLEVGE